MYCWSCCGPRKHKLGTIETPVTDPNVGPARQTKWIFLGVGLAMFIVLFLLVLVYVIKQRTARRRENRDPFSEHNRYSMNPAYSAENNALSGFSNPNYEGDNGAFPLAPQGAAPGGRLILKEAEGHSLPIGFSNRLNEE
eukprot:sb/3474353/